MHDREHGVAPLEQRLDDGGAEDRVVDEAVVGKPAAAHHRHDAHTVGLLRLENIHCDAMAEARGHTPRLASAWAHRLLALLVTLANPCPWPVRLPWPWPQCSASSASESAKRQWAGIAKLLGQEDGSEVFGKRPILTAIGLPVKLVSQDSWSLPASGYPTGQDVNSIACTKLQKPGSFKITTMSKRILLAAFICLLHVAVRQKPAAGQGIKFTEHLIADKYGYAYGLAVADFDGDGDLDLSSRDMRGNALYWFANDGKGSFQWNFIQENEPGWFERHAVGDVQRRQASQRGGREESRWPSRLVSNTSNQ